MGLDWLHLLLPPQLVYKVWFVGTGGTAVGDNGCGLAAPVVWSGLVWSGLVCVLYLPLRGPNARQYWAVKSDQWHPYFIQFDYMLDQL